MILPTMKKTQCLELYIITLMDQMFILVSPIGNTSALTGVDHVKVLNTKSNDTIFIYMSGHAMPDSGQIWGDDLVNALKKKHDALAYKKMVIYIESCYSGSMFEGILPNNINIYATTASNAHEDSYGFYCPDYSSNSPPFFTTCLGDLYSISWMEDRYGLVVK
uniref:Vacuolar-processing enzyme-like isoform X2 n=1 Tax=Cicer arietinum TaxID=3827 RepID=A0A3Q7Y8Y5_CICAR|nr:vacuolar-processing enzyme-like isoform X2 [Cicer arietinum]